MARSTRTRRSAIPDSDESDKEPGVKSDQEMEENEGMEENEDSELDSGPSDNDKNEDDYVEDEDEDEEITTSRRRKRRAMSSDFELDEDVSEDDEFSKKLIEKRFVASDEEDLSEDYEYGQEPKRKKKARSRSRSLEPGMRLGRTRARTAEAEANQDENENSDKESSEDDLKNEIAALYDSSPEPEPLKHKLRERAKIDYTIPPPMAADQTLDDPTAVGAMQLPSFSKGRRGRSTAGKNDYRNLLFPTAGPFGGSDVISVFGTNLPPAVGNGAVPIGQNLEDSDSSDEEIAPINGEATITKKSTNHTTLIGTSTAKNQDKKKNTLSDTDPLGVDMNIDFSAVGGLDNYINQLKEMVALPLLYPELYQNFSITPPRGVLFHGPPGTGKTLMARALASSFSTSSRKITFFMRKGADCLSKWVGEAERQLRLLFEEAKNQQPSIIFFDEIDGLAPVRSSKQEQIHASIVSTLLALMDGMDNRGQVIVIGATNRPDAIDPALRRPGRFDREFYFPLPDVDARSQILKIHTKKWLPPLGDEFVGKIADLTKGYGGADLRALCTEAALNSIQRKYPQIYQTNKKLKVVPSKVKVIAKDFMNAMEKIVPSSARSTTSSSSPLPEHLRCLMEPQYAEIIYKLNNLLPDSVHLKGEKKKTQLEEALYLDPSIKDADGGFGRQQFLKNLENSRICKPSLLISGESGSGQQYIGSAILNHLEGFQVQSLDIGSIFSDSTRTPELAIIQTFIEARRHQPSVIFIPNIDLWYQIVPTTAKATLNSLLKSLKSNEKILLLGISETVQDNLDYEIKLLFASTNESNNVLLRHPDVSQRREFFKTLEKTLLMKPYEFINDYENRPKRKLKELKVIDEPTEGPSNLDKKKQKQQEYEDTKLKNVLKIKLATLMDLFKVRYKRFKKPIIDENLLSHIFFPEILDNPLSNYEVMYVKATDPDHKNMIRELSTGKYYYNIDLDIIEERLWNGFYSEPKQFLKDIKMIVHDASMSGDRERMLKANEMFTNAQFGIDDISTPEFVKACKEMRQREITKQAKLLEEYEKLKQNQDQTSLEVQGANGEAGEINGDTNEKNEENGENGEPNGDANEKVPTQADGETDAAGSNGNVEDNMDERDDTTAAEEPVKETIPAEQTVEELTSHAKPLEATPVEEEAESESESESEAESEPIDTSRQVVLSNYEAFFSSRIVEITSNCNIEKLEIVMAKLMDIVWADRNKWDKTETVQQLYKAADEIESTMNQV